MPFVFGTFVLVLGIVLGTYWALVVLPEEKSQDTLRKRLRGVKARLAQKASLLSEPRPLSHVGALNAVLTREARLFAPLHRTVEQSGLKVTVGTVLLASALAGVLGYLAVTAWTGLAWAGLAAGAGTALLPYAYVRRAQVVRLRKFEEQFPEAIDLIARALRAGHAFTTGLAMVAEEMPDPVGTEFRLLYDLQNFGAPLPDALKKFAERVPLLDARFFVTAVLTQREAGGNLSEVLDNLGSVIRSRFKVKRQVRVISAHARLSGWILACLPPALAVALSVISPQNFRPLFTDPIGIQLIALAITLQVIGVFIIRKIVNVEY